MAVAHAAAGLLAAVWLTATVATAYEVPVDWRAIDAAIAIGQSRIEGPRTRFHERYRIGVARPPVDYLEIVTPFRRVALAAEGHARAGDRLFGQRDAVAVLAAEGGDQLEVIIELTFHPLNTYVGVPAYSVALVPGRGLPVESASLQRIPRFGARVEGMPVPHPYPGVAIPGGAQPLLGGTISARFEHDDVNQEGVYAVVVADEDKEIARARVDLGRLR